MVDDNPSTAARVHPAFRADSAYTGSDPVPVHRLVYRVRLAVPRSLGVAPATFPLPTAELYVDVARERLRARFVGDGWPVPAGSEVRLRRDQPGVYVFDGEGGRPLGPGQLASWFEGGRLRREPSYRVRAPSARDQPFHSDLLCRFIAEWSRQPPDVVMRRCGDDGAPPFFRVGMWRAERTADVSVQLPRSALRADEVGPPPAPASVHSRAYVSPQHLAALTPSRHGAAHPPLRPLDPPAEGLAVQNRGSARAIVTVQGVPVGWVDAGESALFVGLTPGVYAVGAMRPLGLQTAQRRNVAVPATIAVPR
ncbi:MAG: hypothetical protein GXP55_25195 [Deltaproteobacteria bacterium]|nr:hypothetical protein [Deltaproteobacteria bacterium]